MTSYQYFGAVLVRNNRYDLKLTLSPQVEAALLPMVERLRPTLCDLLGAPRRRPRRRAVTPRIHHAARSHMTPPRSHNAPRTRPRAVPPLGACQARTPSSSSSLR